MPCFDEFKYWCNSFCQKKGTHLTILLFTLAEKSQTKWDEKNVHMSFTYVNVMWWWRWHCQVTKFLLSMSKLIKKITAGRIRQHWIYNIFLDTVTCWLLSIYWPLMLIHQRKMGNYIFLCQWINVMYLHMYPLLTLWYCSRNNNLSHYYPIKWLLHL